MRYGTKTMNGRPHPVCAFKISTAAGTKAEPRFAAGASAALGLRTPLFEFPLSLLRLLKILLELRVTLPNQQAVPW